MNNLGDFVLELRYNESEHDQMTSPSSEDVMPTQTLVRSEWLANVSEEIRTPISGMLGMLARVLETSLTREQREFLTLAHNSAKQISHHLNELREYALLEAGRVELSSKPFSLRKLITDSTRDLTESAHRKGLELICDVRSDIPDQLIGDADRLRQIVQTCIDAMIRRTTQGEIEIRLRWEMLENIVRLTFTIRDTAEIPFTDRERLLSRTPSEESDGAADVLALPIAMRLIERMGGQPVLDGESAITFSIDLEPVEVKLPPTNEFVGRLVGWKVLIIADHPTNRQVLRDLFVGWKMEATAVDTPTAALSALWRAALLKRRYALCIVDLRTPVGEGWKLIDQIKSDPELQAVPVIAIGTAADEAEFEKSKQFGVPWVRKPVYGPELLEGIRQLSAKPLPAPLPEPVAKSASQPRQRLRVLLADANEINGMLVQHWMNEEGHDLTATTTIAAALDALAKQAFDVVIFDLDMPDMDGLQAARMFRDQDTKAGRRTHLIALTAYLNRTSQERWHAAGINDHLLKPLNKMELERKLSQRLSATDRASGDDDTKKKKGASLLSPETILASTGSQEALLRKVVALFRQRGPELIERLRAGVTANNSAEWRQSAHALRGVVAIFSSRVAEKIATLENESKLGPSERSTNLLNEIEQSFGQLDDVLASLTVEEVRKMIGK